MYYRLFWVYVKVKKRGLIYFVYVSKVLGIT